MFHSVTLLSQALLARGSSALPSVLLIMHCDDDSNVWSTMPIAIVGGEKIVAISTTTYKLYLWNLIITVAPLKLHKMHNIIILISYCAMKVCFF